METFRASAALLLRVALLLAGCLLSAAGAWWLSSPPLLALAAAGELDREPLETVVVGLCAAALLCCAGWLVVTTALALMLYVARVVAPRNRQVAALGRSVERRCPAAVRRLVTATVGVALTTTLGGTALADPPASGGREVVDLDGLALPDRTSGTSLSTRARRTVALPVGPQATQRVVVRHGDSLWSISARLLPSRATDAEVTGTWHRLHRANADRVGEDPDLIHPGTRLLVPGLPSPHRKDAP